MSGTIITTAGLHIVAATVTIVLFLIYRDITLRSGREASKGIGTATGVSLLITTYLLGRTYLSVFGPLVTAIVIVGWITTVLLAESYFVERPLRANHKGALPCPSSKI